MVQLYILTFHIICESGWFSLELHNKNVPPVLDRISDKPGVNSVATKGTPWKICGPSEEVGIKEVPEGNISPSHLSR